MKPRFLFLFSMVLLIQSQTWSQRGVIRRQVEKDVERKLEDKYSDDRQKGEKAVDERLDRMDELDAEFRAGVKPFPTLSYKMSVEYPEKPKNNTEMYFAFKQFDCAMRMEAKPDSKEETRIITNFKSGKAVTLTTDRKGRKTGMEMDMKLMTSMARGSANKENELIEEGKVEIKVTDEYKTINGYKCRKYIYEHPQYTAFIWVTNDRLPVNARDFSFAMANAMNGSKGAPNTACYQKLKGGVCIQTHIIPKQSRMEETIMTYTDFSNSAPEAMFTTAGYEIQQMPSMRDMWNNYKEESR